MVRLRVSTTLLPTLMVISLPFESSAMVGACRFWPFASLIYRMPFASIIVFVVAFSQ